MLEIVFPKFELLGWALLKDRSPPLAIDVDIGETNLHTMLRFLPQREAKTLGFLRGHRDSSQRNILSNTQNEMTHFFPTAELTPGRQKFSAEQW